MADKDSYPRDTDLAMFIDAAGVIDTTGENFQKIDLEAKLDAAVDEWEQATGWHPFLGDAQDVVRVFDHPGPAVTRQANLLTLRGGGKKLFLGGGLVSLTSLTIGGTAYEQGTQFWLRPNNADVKKKPFTSIEFLVPVFGPPQGIVITGRWGYWPTLRSSVWQAVLQKAAALCVPEIGLNISGGLYKIEDVQFSNSGGMTPLSGERQQWETYFAQTAEDYTRDM